MDSMDIAGELFGGRIDNSNYIFTPQNIVEDMINLIPDDFWTPDKKILDIYTKSGRFLKEAFKRLYNSPYLADMDIAKRKNHILTEQLYGLTDDFTCLLLSERDLYGYAQYGKKNIRMIDNMIPLIQSQDHKLINNVLGKEFNTVKFDLVIGNPPYNKGMDLDFVDLGYKLSSQYTVMITPAKWQTTADDYSGCASKNINYKKFRELYVPHMSTVVFYPDALDIFHISQVDGLTYFLIDKEIHSTATVTNVSFHQKYYNSVSDRDIKNRQTLINIGQEIVDYLGTYNTFSVEHTNKKYTYKVVTNSQIVLCGAGSEARKASDAVGRLSNMFNNDGQATFIGTPKIGTFVPAGAYGCAFSSDNKSECESFVSWLNCKFTRFFVAINISKLTGILTDDYFRFVPAPSTGKFDHIYTDEELYKAFNLPQKYIDVIESVIKERK